MPSTSAARSSELIEAYYAAFNRQDAAAMLSMVADDLVHEPSQGAARKGRQAFAEFLAHMNRCYAEEVLNPIVLVNNEGTRAAAEFQLDGRYLQTDDGLPEADGQAYNLRVGAFFDIQNGKITRVSNHYNLADWTAQVSTARA